MTRISELKKRWMRDPKFRKEYEKADEEFAVIEALIRARTKAQLSQPNWPGGSETTQSAIARLEGGGVSASLSTLRRYAEATGTELHVELRSG